MKYRIIIGDRLAPHTYTSKTKWLEACARIRKRTDKYVQGIKIRKRPARRRKRK